MWYDGDRESTGVYVVECLYVNCDWRAGRLRDVGLERGLWGEFAMMNFLDDGGEREWQGSK